MNEKVILITGASSGVGKACANYLLEQGHIIFGTRRTAVFSESQYNSKKVNILPLELRDKKSMIDVINTIIKICGRIDVVINNAGVGIGGPVEDTPIEEAKRIMDINFFGGVQLIQEILPIFRKQNYGLIINISSLAGRFSLPFQGFYAATKFAIEAISEALYMELKNSSLNVVLIQPGDLSTNFTNNRKEFISKESHLELSFKKALSILKNDERSGASPIAVAYIIERIIKSKRHGFRYVLGKEAWYVRILHSLLSDRIFLHFLARHYGL
ncbi:SDR family oxidoreductase [Patescibacteria group bacterium]|nr:MAG: SDR family oxidoreductase [Patescibacteria group bacterium]